MKKIIIISIAIFLSLATGFANTNPPSENASSLASIKFEINANLSNDHSMDIIYNAKNEVLNMTTNDPIQFLQVLNIDGILEFQLPVNSTKVSLDLNDFEKGKYQLNFIFNEGKIVPSYFEK